MDIIFAFGVWPVVAIGLIALFLILMFLGDGFVFIPNDSYGVVERKWSLAKGNDKDKIGFMTLGSGAGFLPEVIHGGWHRFTPFMYKVHRQKLVTVRDIGYLFARTGVSLPQGQALAEWPTGVEPRDARAFLTSGGQEGPQRHILRAASYAINTALFVVMTEDGVHEIPLGDGGKVESFSQQITDRDGYRPVFIKDDQIGIVTVQDGPAIDHDEIIAPTSGC